MQLDLNITLQLSPALERLLRGILKLEAMNVADKQEILNQVGNLTAEVERQKGVNASVKTLISGQAQQITDLSNQVAALKAGTVTQEEIDSLAASLKTVADGYKANDDELANAISANPA